MACTVRRPRPVLLASSLYVMRRPVRCWYSARQYFSRNSTCPLFGRDRLSLKNRTLDAVFFGGVLESAAADVEAGDAALRSGGRRAATGLRAKDRGYHRSVNLVQNDDCLAGRCGAGGECKIALQLSLIKSSRSVRSVSSAGMRHGPTTLRKMPCQDGREKSRFGCSLLARATHPLRPYQR